MRYAQSLGVVLALAVGPAVAQTTDLDDVQKAASAPLTATLTAADLGQPIVDLPKVDGLAVSVRADARVTGYDEDKIDGNEPQPVPLGDRAKAASVLEAGIDPAALGQPAADAAKTADVGVSIASDAVPTIYDEDKIAGNEPPPEPLTERQKLPGTATEGLDAAALGTPATDAPKTADLAVSLAADSGPNIDDNDKIVGNAYVQPPLGSRTKVPSVLPDPVVDADMGQPATDAPKTATATVSLAADAVPNIDDNDKIVGNPVVNPPLADRAKLPSDTFTEGLAPEELGLPADETAPKTATLDAGRLAEAVTSSYDEDKIADDTAYDDSYDGSSDFDPGPPPELIAQIRGLLDDADLRTDILAQAAGRVAVPDTMGDAVSGYLTALFDQPAVRDALANAVAAPFAEFGLSPDNPGVVARMTAEQLAVFGDDLAVAGIVRLPVDAQRGYLTDLLRVAEPLPADQCGPFLSGDMDVGQARRIELAAMATWTPDEVEASLIRQAAAIVAELQDSPTRQSLSPTDLDRGRELAGTKILAILDAMPNGADLIAAYGSPWQAAPDDLCQVQTIILRAALETDGPDGDLMVGAVLQDGGVY